MPKRAQYTVIWSPERARYLLAGPENEARDISEDEESWLTWLEEHSAFAFRGRNGQINLLKEQRGRGGEGYWYAYQRRKGKMVKRYVGRGALIIALAIGSVILAIPTLRRHSSNVEVETKA